MTTDTQCARCPRPAVDATVCVGCRLTLETALAQLPALIAELEVTAARQNVQGEHDGRGSTEQPLPVHIGAMDALRQIRAVIVSWSALLHEEKPAALPTDTTPAGLAPWLADHTGWLTRHPAAMDVVDEIVGAHDRALLVIDNQDQPIYWGPCSCGSDLYGLHDATSICCAGCRTEYDAGQRRTELLAAAEDRLATTTEIERFTAQLGQRVPAGTIRQWVARGQMLAHSVDSAGIPLYRVGDVVARLRARLDRGAAGRAQQHLPRPGADRLAA